MKRSIFFLLIALLFAGCSSDSNPVGGMDDNNVVVNTWSPPSNVSGSYSATVYSKNRTNINHPAYTAIAYIKEAMTIDVIQTGDAVTVSVSRKREVIQERTYHASGEKQTLVTQTQTGVDRYTGSYSSGKLVATSNNRWSDGQALYIEMSWTQSGRTIFARHLNNSASF